MKIEHRSEVNTADQQPLIFAAKELNEYLFRMGSPKLHISLLVTDLSKYGMDAVEDKNLDDQYYIDINESQSIICGNNPRAVLLGVYRYLQIVGCRFLRPGKEYEIVPIYTDIRRFFANEAHTASFRHRGVCIEGCDSIDNIADFLDWLPKVGYNSFFFQFENPHTFLKRWFDWKNNRLPSETQTNWTFQDSTNIMQYFDECMRNRGLLRHRVGHGWTAKVLKASNTFGWSKEELVLSDEIGTYVAQINEKRELFQNRPVNTNLCLTNPKARQIFCKHVLEYLTAHPDTEYLHIWLADGQKNSCECKECRKLRPADHYLTLLNDLDDVLTTHKIQTKLCFLMYTDLLWAPLQNKLNNKERFVFMFAPICRSFDTSYKTMKELPEPPAFVLNISETPNGTEQNVSLLKAWQKQIECDTFVYDYPLGRAHHSDPAHIKISRIIYDDIQSYQTLGLNGISSCQELRISFPNALANYVMGQSTLNLKRSFEEISEEYYVSAYGESGKQLLLLMTELSECFTMDYFNPFNPSYEEMSSDIINVPSVLSKIKALKDNRAATVHEVQEKMWNKLDLFLDYTAVLTEMVIAQENGDTEKAKNMFEQNFSPLSERIEQNDQAILDVKRDLETIRIRLFP